MEIIMLSAMKRMERNVFEEFGYAEIMGEHRMVKRGFRECVEGNRRRGRPQRR